MTQATKKDIGKWCKFYKQFCDKTIFTIARLKKINVGYYFYDEQYNIARSLKLSLHCTPLTQEQIKCLGLEE